MKGSGYSQERKGNRTLKTQQKHITSIQTPRPTPPKHHFPFSWKTSTQTKTHKHIKSLKFYTLVLHVFDIKFLSSSSSLTEPT